MVAAHERFLALGLESPFTDEWFERPDQDERITTTVDISDFVDVRPRALLAHRTQVDPESKMWFGLPREEARTVHPYDEYVLARSLVDSRLPEDDLFAGVGDRVMG
jgi:mycothiol S-conjugate amidase